MDNSEVIHNFYVNKIVFIHNRFTFKSALILNSNLFFLIIVRAKIQIIRKRSTRQMLIKAIENTYLKHLTTKKQIIKYQK